MFFSKRLKKFDPQKEQALRDEIAANGGLEKNDFKAMVISAFLMLMPAAVIMLLILVAFVALFF